MTICDEEMNKKKLPLKCSMAGRLWLWFLRKACFAGFWGILTAWKDSDFITFRVFYYWKLKCKFCNRVRKKSKTNLFESFWRSALVDRNCEGMQSPFLSEMVHDKWFFINIAKIIRDRNCNTFFAKKLDFLYINVSTIVEFLTGPKFGRLQFWQTQNVFAEFFLLTSDFLFSESSVGTHSSSMISSESKHSSPYFRSIFSLQVSMALCLFMHYIKINQYKHSKE